MLCHILKFHLFIFSLPLVVGINIRGWMKNLMFVDLLIWLFDTFFLIDDLYIFSLIFTCDNFLLSSNYRDMNIISLFLNMML